MIVIFTKWHVGVMDVHWSYIIQRSLLPPLQCYSSPRWISCAGKMSVYIYIYIYTHTHTHTHTHTCMYVWVSGVVSHCWLWWAGPQMENLCQILQYPKLTIYWSIQCHTPKDMYLQIITNDKKVRFWSDNCNWRYYLSIYLERLSKITKTLRYDNW